MDNVKGILILLTLALSAATFLLFLKASTAQSQLSDATILASAAHQLLKVQEAACSASQDNFRGIAQCIAPMLRAKDFKQYTFDQPDAKKGTDGILVIKNANKRTYDGEKFIMLVNRQEWQMGCDAPGPVGPDVTCRFTFSQACEQGDLLEVTYPVNDTQARVFLKTC